MKGGGSFSRMKQNKSEFMGFRALNYSKCLQNSKIAWWIVFSNQILFESGQKVLPFWLKFF